MGQHLVLVSRLGRWSGGRGSVDQREQRHLLAARAKLLGDLEGDDATKGRSAEQIWPAWLNGAQRVDVARRHILDAGQRLALRVEARRLQPVDRLLGSQ